MRVTLLTLLVVSLLAVPGAARAQSVDPSGHWEGAITIPGVRFPSRWICRRTLKASWSPRTAGRRTI